MKNYWLTIALITFCALFATLVVVRTMEIDVFQIRTAQIVALINILIIGLLVWLHSQHLRIGLLQDELRLERMRQEGINQELEEKINKLESTVIAERISKSLSKRR